MNTTPIMDDADAAAAPLLRQIEELRQQDNRCRAFCDGVDPAMLHPGRLLLLIDQIGNQQERIAELEREAKSPPVEEVQTLYELANLREERDRLKAEVARLRKSLRDMAALNERSPAVFQQRIQSHIAAALAGKEQ